MIFGSTQQDTFERSVSRLTHDLVSECSCVRVEFGCQASLVLWRSGNRVKQIAIYSVFQPLRSVNLLSCCGADRCPLLLACTKTAANMDSMSMQKCGTRFFSPSCGLFGKVSSRRLQARGERTQNPNTCPETSFRQICLWWWETHWKTAHCRFRTCQSTLPLVLERCLPKAQKDT